MDWMSKIRLYGRVAFGINVPLNIYQKNPPSSVLGLGDWCNGVRKWLMISSI